MSEIIPLAAISTPPDRQREVFPEAAMEELKASILTMKGLMCPILVRPDAKLDGQFILVAGERRLRVIKTIQTHYAFGEQMIAPGFIPAVVKQFPNDMEVMEAELHENTIRLNLTWQERAAAIAKLHALKVMKNPQHSIGETAYILDDKTTALTTGFATANVYKRVEASLLVNKFLQEGDADVQKASSLADATKIATRKIEAQLMIKLKEHREAKQALIATQPVTAEPTEELSRDEDPVGFLLRQRSECVLLEGDMREQIRNVPSGSINVIVTDPPYGEGVDDFGDAASLRHDYSEENFEELYETLIAELPRICAPSAHIYIFCNFEYFFPLREKIAALKGWRVRKTPLIWTKGSTGNLADGTAQGYKRSYELILYASQGKRPCSGVISDVIYFPMVRQKVHAAQKPVELYSKLLTMSAVPGDTVLDCFAGSGTIFHAAQALALKSVGIEMNPLFIEMCRLAMEGKEPNWKAEV